MAGRTVVILGMLLWAAPVSGEQATADQKESSEPREESNKMEETIIHADLLIENFKDQQAELYVNDIPVARVGGKLQPWASVPVPEYVIDGANTLTVVIGIGNTPSVAKAGIANEKCDPEMAVHARIVRMKEGEPARSGSGEMLVEIKWNGKKEEPFPVTVSAKGDLGKQLGAWQWQSADALTLDSATYESAAKFISEINAAYTGGKPDPIIKVAKFKHSEAGRAYPEYGDVVFDDMFREQMEMTSKEPNWKPYALPRNEYDLRLVANGRLIEAVAKDWRPILRMEDGDYAFPMHIGKVKGEWQILR
ncbi:MAG: hypothetical protein E4G91_04505 [Candidatus Zixiibacteriota bacterium]|nr:MAG: hypothetical protein E4G91_04505 [candidate division Zixibacteria bacterium]